MGTRHAGFKHVQASIGALLGLTEIVFSIMFGILIFGEALTSSVAIGGLLIIVAAVLPNIKDLVNSKPGEVVSAPHGGAS